MNFSSFMQPTSETDLLASQNLYEPLTAFDGKAAAIIGDFIYTSPNQDVIWALELKEGVYLRSDFRFGPHDHMLWPQPFIPEYSYLGAIPSKPIDLHDPLSILWWNPSEGDFLSPSAGAVDGIGQLRKARYSRFEEMKKDLDDRIATYNSGNPSHTVLQLLQRDIHHVLTRLGTLRTTFSQMVFSVTEYQCCYLEALGLLNYLEIYKLCRYGNLPSATTVAKCVGLITHLPNIVQEFFCAGIPVWLVRPLKPGPFPHNVLHVVTPFNPSDFLCIDKAVPPSPVIYDSALNSYDKHNALHRFSQSWLVFKDPFAHQLLPSSQPSTKQPSTKQASTYRTDHGPHSSTSLAGQDKFTPFTHSLALYPIPAWVAALQAVDRSALFEYKMSTRFAFPDPALLVTPAKDETKARRIETWVRIHDAWINRLAHEGSLAMSMQEWHDILTIDLSRSLGETKTAKRYKTISNMLVPKSLSPEVMLRNPIGEPISWQGHNYVSGQLPLENVVRQILWELYELNFIREFLSLDCRACMKLDLTDGEQLLERQSLILQCFYLDPLTSVSLPSTNYGLATDTIQFRLPFLWSMVQVMILWKGTKPTAFCLEHRLPLTDEQAKELEDAVTSYYCQQFYSYFGCAAQVPHQLFSAVQ